MAKLNYEKDVRPLVAELQRQFFAARNKKIIVKNQNEKWQLYFDTDQIYDGTLREVYCYLTGMSEFLL